MPKVRCYQLTYRLLPLYHRRPALVPTLGIEFCELVGDQLANLERPGVTGVPKLFHLRHDHAARAAAVPGTASARIDEGCLVGSDFMVPPRLETSAAKIAVKI